MTSVKVKFSVVFKDVTGIEETDIEINEKTIENLLEVLIARFGSDFKEKVIDDDTGELRRFVNIFVNGKDIRNLSGLDTEVDDGAEVRLIPAVAGGEGEFGFSEDQIVRYSRQIVFPR